MQTNTVFVGLLQWTMTPNESMDGMQWELNDKLIHGWMFSLVNSPKPTIKTVLVLILQ